MNLKLNTLFLHLILIIVYVESKHSSKECDCSETLDKMSKIETVLRTVVKAIADRTYLINEVKHLNVWKESQAYITERLEAEVQQLKERLEVEILPSSQPLVSQPEEKMQRDAEAGSGGFEEDRRDVPKEVSVLLAKVEEVENRTIQVQEKLESERRVRRHLEESLNETRTSMHILGDKLQNITAPDNKITHVEEVLLSTLENINKTLFEDHLQKLYYKIDGVVYRNETKLLNERLDQVEIEVQENNNYNNNNNNLTQLTMLLKTLEDNVRQINDSIQSELTPRHNDSESAQTKRLKTLEERVIVLSTSSDVLKMELEDIRSNLEISTNLRRIFLNLTEDWRSSLSNIGEQVNELKKLIFKENDSSMSNKPATKINNESETKDSKISTTECEPPQVDDQNLLVIMETDESGNQTLQFGCFPVGQYVLNPVPIPARCENGTWQGPFPTCTRLLTEKEIQVISNNLGKFNPCLKANGTFEDPTNCSRFFMCTHQRQMLTSCPGNLHFIAAKKQCVYPYNSRCIPFSDIDATSELQSLRNFIPPIQIQPHNLDMPYGLMGTGPLGEVVLYPGTTFTLQCLFPDTIFGQPKWFVYNFQTGLEEERNHLKEGHLHYNLKIAAAKENDSGVYACKTPYGKEASVTVIVKEITCPSITDDEDVEKAVFYRPTPEGQSRIISTTALFQCEDGHSITAMCLADGTWSRTAPTAEECIIKDTRAYIFWGCPPLDFSNHPYLIIERKEEGTKLMFSCDEDLNLIGPPSISCVEGKKWTHTSLPKCEEHGKSYIDDESIVREFLG